MSNPKTTPLYLTSREAELIKCRGKIDGKMCWFCKKPFSVTKKNLENKTVRCNRKRGYGQVYDIIVRNESRRR